MLLVADEVCQLDLLLGTVERNQCGSEECTTAVLQVYHSILGLVCELLQLRGLLQCISITHSVSAQVSY